MTMMHAQVLLLVAVLSFGIGKLYISIINPTHMPVLYLFIFNPRLTICLKFHLTEGKLDLMITYYFNRCGGSLYSCMHGAVFS